MGKLALKRSFTCLLILISIAPAYALNPEVAFRRPLIIGASVSADFKALSPGKRLALRYTQPANIVTFARFGRPAAWVLPALPKRMLEDRTIVVGLDLFFWDSLSPLTGHSVRLLRKLMAQVRARQLPIVLGEVPLLIAGLQPGRTRLNAALRAECSAYEQCYLMPLDQIHAELIHHELISASGAPFEAADLLADRLHLSDHGSEYLANVMLQLLEARRE
jgi:hypothetical protein